MQTPKTVLNFTQQKWLPVVHEIQRLQADISQICTALGIPQAAHSSVLLKDGILSLKSSAALSIRLRHIQPELFRALTNKGWKITAIILGIQKNANPLQNYISSPDWINPNEMRYGKRTRPSPEQQALLQQFIKPRTLAKQIKFR